MSTLTEEQFKKLNTILKKVALAADATDPRDRFPDPKDRSPNQPAVIMQPDAIMRLARHVNQQAGYFYHAGDKGISDSSFHDMMMQYAHCSLCNYVLAGSDVSTDVGYSWKDHGIFIAIAELVGWTNIVLVGRQIVLAYNPQKVKT